MRPDPRLTHDIVADESLETLATLYLTCHTETTSTDRDTAGTVILGVRQALTAKLRDELATVATGTLEVIIRDRYALHAWQIPEDSLDDVVVDVCNGILEDRYDLGDVLAEISAALPYSTPLDEVNKKFVDLTFAIVALRQ